MTFDGHSPGTIGVEPLAIPPDMTPAQWAKHAVSHLPYHPGCRCCVAARKWDHKHPRRKVVGSELREEEDGGAGGRDEELARLET